MLSRTAFALVLSAMLSAPAFATGVAYEGFNYTPGTILDTQNGGTGWTGAWQEFPNLITDPKDDNVQANSLTFNAGGQTLATSGGHLQSIGTTSDDFRTFTTGTSLYFSVLMRHDVAAQGTGDYGGLVIDGTNGSDFFIGDPGNSDTLSVGLANNDASLVGSTTTLGTGGVVLLVAKVTVGAGNDSIRFWVNPVPGSTELSNGTFFDKTNADIGTLLSSLELISGTGSTYSFDEVRVGTAWEDVTPGVAVPEPAALAQVGAGFPMLLMRRRRVK